MVEKSWQRAKELFLELSEADEESRAERLVEVAEKDPWLAREVDSLLRNDLELLSPTENAARLPTVLAELQDESWIDRQLGPYRLKSRLGRGGMGVVYLAERADQEYDQRVAIKILPLGLDSALALDRFRQERQILAMLDHPNIARLLDGGTTADGLPYLVMDYVEGEAITAACDRRRLSIEARLELFFKVCSAVSFAHRRLVVHRDLKPGNILVTEDGEPKLLDFGIAKLLRSTADPQTKTRDSFLTPRYASPEQRAGAPISTASDVYSLAVLLDELLSGRPPEQSDSQATATRGEPGSWPIGRWLPGRRRGASAELAAAAECRNTTVQGLRRALAGDLEIVLAKALRSDPAARYGSVDRWVDDLDRCRRGLPIAARPPTWRYRIGKFMRRHLLAVGASVAFLALVLAFAITSLFLAREAARERDLARQQQGRAERVSTLLKDAFLQADPARTRGANVTAREILEAGVRSIRNSLDDDLVAKADLLHTIGSVQAALGLFSQASGALEEALILKEQTLGPASESLALTQKELASLQYVQGDLDGAHETAQVALRGFLATASAGSADTLRLLGDIEFDRSNRPAGIVLHRRAVEETIAYFGAQSLEHASGLVALGETLELEGDRGEASELFRQSLALLDSLDAARHPTAARALRRLARLAGREGRAEEGLVLGRQAAQLAQELYGEEHPMVADALTTLGSLYRDLGDGVRALANYQRALRIQEGLLGSENPELATKVNNIGGVLFSNQGFAEAEGYFRRAIELQLSGGGEDNLRMGYFKAGLGATLIELARPGEAEDHLRGAIAIFSRHSRGGADGRNACVAKADLGGAFLRQGRVEEAENLLIPCHEVLSRDGKLSNRFRFRAARWLVELYQTTGRESLAADLEEWMSKG